MKFSSSTLLGFLLLLSFISSAQDFEVPPNLPSTKEEFVKSERDIINAARWLESTPVGIQMDKRTKVNAWVIVLMIPNRNRGLRRWLREKQERKEKKYHKNSIKWKEYQ